MITQGQFLAIFAAKWARRIYRSYYVKTSTGRLVRFVDWKN